MSNKRFTWKTEKLKHFDDEVLMVVDNINKDWKGHTLNIVDLLNYQDRLIEDQHDEIINWTKKYLGIKKDNEQLRILLNEAEDMIETRLAEHYIQQYQNIKKGVLDE